MITLKIILFSAICSSLGGVVWVFAEMTEASWSLILTGLGTVITAIFGGLVLYNQSRSRTRLEEMKTQAELDRAKAELEHKLHQTQMEAQRTISSVNAAALTNVQKLLADNTVETVKSAAAADQAKVRIEQLEAKLPIKQSDTPIDVNVTNPPENPVNTTPV